LVEHLKGLQKWLINPLKRSLMRNALI
jgi:hypothetical protein